MRPAVRMRRATQGDAASIAYIHMAARRHSLPYLPELHSEDETYMWISNIVLPNQEVWVATLDDVVVGYAAVDGAELSDLYVAPQVHGRGIGSVLLQKAQERSAGVLRLWTFQRNTTARAFYEHRGFGPIELTDGGGNEEREPDVRYEWTASNSSDRSEDLNDSETQADGCG